MKICLQAGHKNMKTGATGAPGERDWTSKIVPMVANLLTAKGIEAYQCDAFADKDEKVTSSDWDLFLAVHYDADVYNEGGGFVDYPDPSVDSNWERSKYLANRISEYYFSNTKIPNRPSRSNANTKFYYMWSSLSKNTPCVLIECGVGNRKPEDYTVLRKYDFISQTIADAILTALGLKDDNETKLAELEKTLSEVRDSRDKWKNECSELSDKISKLNKQIESMQKSNSELTAQLTLSNKTNKDMIDSLNERIDSLTKEKTTLLDDSVALQAQLNDVLSLQSESTVKMAELQEKVEDLQKRVKAGLLSYSRLELIKYILFKK